MKNSTNQSVKPITTRRNDYGYLEIGGCDLTELVNKYSTPLYVIDEATLRAVCSDYKEAFKLGVCTGSASAFSEQLATREQVEAIRNTHHFEF